MWGKSKERIFIENSRENTKYMDVFCVLGVLSLWKNRGLKGGKKPFFHGSGIAFTETPMFYVKPLFFLF